jgi:hypothetical protein
VVFSIFAAIGCHDRFGILRRTATQWLEVALPILLSTSTIAERNFRLKEEDPVAVECNVQAALHDHVHIGPKTNAIVLKGTKEVVGVLAGTVPISCILMVVNPSNPVIDVWSPILRIWIPCRAGQLSVSEGLTLPSERRPNIQA